MIQHSPEPTQPKSPKLPFLAFAKTEAELASLREFAESQRWGTSGILQGDILTAAEFLKSNPSPEILLVEIGGPKEAQAQLDALADVCDPQAKVIVIGEVNEYSFYCWLMDIGISSYLLKPLTKEALSSAHAKATEKPAAAKAETAKQPGKVVAVLGTRGGVGATTLAINLAGILAAKSTMQVGLVDLDAQEGSVALMLDLEPSRGMREALEKPDRMDGLFIDRVMQKPMKQLSVLSAEESLSDSLHVHEEAAETLLRELRARFDVIVVDIPRILSPIGRCFLRQVEHVLLVSELSLVSLRDAMRLSDVLREQFRAVPQVIANRVGMAAKQELLPADFEKGLNKKLALRVPFAPELFMPVGITVPAVTQPAHAGAKPLYELMATLFPDMEASTPEKPKKARRFNLLKSKKD